MLNLDVLQNYLQPSVEILNVRVDEPVTSLTDLVLAAICFYAFFRINKIDVAGRIKIYFKYYFLLLGIGALTGGLLGHAFLYRIAEGWKLVSWVCTLSTVILLASALMDIARPFLKPGISKTITMVNALIFIIALILTLWSGAFAPVKYYMIFGMVVLVGYLSSVVYRETKNRGVLVLMGAVGVGIFSAVVFSFEWGFSPWFNHRDVSHMILIISAYILYRGASQIMNDSTISMM